METKHPGKEAKHPANETKYPAKETKRTSSVPRSTPPRMVLVHKIHYFLVHVHIHTYTVPKLYTSTAYELSSPDPFSLPPTCVSAGGSNSPVYLQVAQTARCICRWLKQPGVSAGGSNSPVYLQVAQTARCICRWLKQPGVSAGGSNSPVYLQVAQTARCICRWLKQPGVSAGGSNSLVYLQVAQTAVFKSLIPVMPDFLYMGLFPCRQVSMNHLRPVPLTPFRLFLF